MDPSDEAWIAFGAAAARILVRLAEQDAAQELEAA